MNKSCTACLSRSIITLKNSNFAKRLEKRIFRLPTKFPRKYSWMGGYPGIAIVDFSTWRKETWNSSHKFTQIYIPRSSSGCTISVPKGISEPGVEVLKFLLGSFFNFQLVLDWLATLNIHSRHPWCPLCRFSHFYLQVSQSAKSTDKLLRSQSVDQGIGPRNRIIANSTISHTLTIQCYSMVSAMDLSWFFWYIRMDAPATGLL